MVQISKIRPVVNIMGKDFVSSKNAKRAALSAVSGLAIPAGKSGDMLQKKSAVL